jgi:integrase
VYSRKDRARVRKTFSEYWEAKVWRHQQLELASIGLLRPPSRHTLGEVASAWIEMAREGQIHNRSGRHYKPSALRTIETDLRVHLVPSLGTKVMAQLRRAELQRLVGSWLAAELSPSKIRSIVNAGRVLWRDFDLATGHEDPLLIDPTRGLRLPASTGPRERIATPDEARRLIEALLPRDRALWATAMYAGLRHGELRAAHSTGTASPPDRAAGVPPHRDLADARRRDHDRQSQQVHGRGAYYVIVASSAASRVARFPRRSAAT